MLGSCREFGLGFNSGLRYLSTRGVVWITPIVEVWIVLSCKLLDAVTSTFIVI